MASAVSRQHFNSYYRNGRDQIARNDKVHYKICNDGQILDLSSLENPYLLSGSKRKLLCVRAPGWLEPAGEGENECCVLSLSLGELQRTDKQAVREGHWHHCSVCPKSSSGDCIHTSVKSWALCVSFVHLTSPSLLPTARAFVSHIHRVYLWHFSPDKPINGSCEGDHLWDHGLRSQNGEETETPWCC